MATCEVKYPTVTTADGKEIEAPLYKALKGVVDILTARELYNDAISEDFKKEKFYADIALTNSFDEYGQPTLESLIKYTDLSKVIDKVIYAESVKKELFGDKITIENTADFIQSLAKIRDWNSSHDYYKAILVKESDGTLNLQINKNTMSVAKLVANVDRFLENMEQVNVSGAVKDLFSFYMTNYNVINSTSTLNPDLILEKLNILKSGKAEYNDFVSVLPNLPVYSNNLGLRMSKLIAENTNFLASYINKYSLLPGVGMGAVADVVSKDPKKYAGIVKNHFLYMAYKNSLVSDAMLKGLENAEYIEKMIKRLNENLTNDLKSIQLPEKEKTDNTVEVPNLEIDSNYFQKKLKESANAETNIVKKILFLEKDIINRAGKTYSKDEVKKIAAKRKALEKVVESGDTYEGLINYLKDTIDYLKELQQNIKKDDPLNKQAKSLKILLDKCNEYSNIVDYFNEYIDNSQFKNDVRDYLVSLLEKEDIQENIDNITSEQMEEYYALHENLRQYKNIFDEYFNNDLQFHEVDTLTTIISKFNTNLKTYAVELTAQFLERYQTEEGSVIKWGEHKGEQVDIKQLLLKCENDVNLYNKLFSAMSDCPDTIFRLTDKAMKIQKGKARIEAQELMRQIKMEATLLERAGIRDFSWLYERYSDGTKTGRYITREGNPEEYAEIEANPAKKRFYDFFMKTKNKLNMMYPESAIPDPNKIIGIRKDRLERLKYAKGIKGFGKEILEGIKDNYMERSDDDDIAGYSELFTDASGNEFKLLPVYYNNFNTYDAEQMSEDAVSTLIAYAAKAVEYKHLNEVIDLIEVEKIALKERLIPSTDGKLKVLNLFNRSFYKGDKSVTADNIVYHKDNGTSNAYKMFDGWVDMQFYGRWRDREGTIGNTNISTAKVIDQLNKKTAMASMSLNMLNGIANVLTGLSQTRVETITGTFGTGYFSIKEMAEADAILTKETMPYLAELGNRVKTSKLALLSEMFNVSQSYEQDVSEVEWHRDNWAKRFMTSGALGFLNKSGEFMMSHRIAIASLLHTKVVNKNGAETSLYNALVKEYLQEDGTYGKEDKGLGARLTLDDTYTLNGKPFVTYGDSQIKIERKLFGIISKKMGIYNKQDANLIQKKAWGRLIYMFRKWIPAAIDNRFMELQYNYDTDEWKEGYYRTTYNFIKQLIAEREGLKLELKVKWRTLEPEQRNNIIRALAESGIFIMLLTLQKILPEFKPDGDDTDKDNFWDFDAQSYAYSLLFYELIRRCSEQAALTPISIINPDQSMASELLKFFTSPIAAANTAQDSYSILGLLNPFVYFEEVKAGKFKGHTKAYKIIMSNKYWNPLGMIWHKNFHPEEYAGWYK